MPIAANTLEMRLMTDVMPERTEFSTTPPSEERSARLRHLFLKAINDGEVDVESLRRSLGDAFGLAKRRCPSRSRWNGASKK